MAAALWQTWPARRPSLPQRLLRCRWPGAPRQIAHAIFLVQRRLTRCPKLHTCIRYIHVDHQKTDIVHCCIGSFYAILVYIYAPVPCAI
ncbi:hypothetical protein BS78_09G262500 [Paspalum vaginatum]|nr:hypothetical protein BS78_09G262500 [Paspalum vaginatum]